MPNFTRTASLPTRQRKERQRKAVSSVRLPESENLAVIDPYISLARREFQHPANRAFIG